MATFVPARLENGAIVSGPPIERQSHFSIVLVPFVLHMEPYEVVNGVTNKLHANTDMAKNLCVQMVLLSRRNKWHDRICRNIRNCLMYDDYELAISETMAMHRTSRRFMSTEMQKLFRLSIEIMVAGAPNVVTGTNAFVADPMFS